METFDRIPSRQLDQIYRLLPPLIWKLERSVVQQLGAGASARSLLEQDLSQDEDWAYPIAATLLLLESENVNPRTLQAMVAAELLIRQQAAGVYEIPPDAE